MIAIPCVVALFGAGFAPHSSTALIAGSFETGRGYGLFGTDVLGRDVLSRVLDGGRVLLLASATATLIGVGVGTVAGIAAAYRQGWADSAIMRTVDIFLAFPAIILGLLIVSVMGPQLWVLILAVSLAHMPQVARVMRAAAGVVSEADHIKASELWGVPSRKVILRGILPNLVTPLLVEIGLCLGYSVAFIAGLSFLGFGVQPPNADWGRMINENRIGLTQNPWGVMLPALLIAVFAVGTSTFSDAVARVSLGLEKGEQAVIAGSIVAQGAVDAGA